MKHRYTILIQYLLVLFLCVADASMAADTPEKKPTKTVAEPNVSAAWQRRLPGYLSDNLPLNEIIRHLRQQFPEINFLIKQQADTEIDVASITINMTLRAVTLQEFLKALEIAAQRPIQITGEPGEGLVVFESKAAALAVDAAGLPLHTSPVQTRVFSISQYLAYRSDEESAVALKELENVLHTAGDMLSEASNGVRRFDPKLRIHRGTKLLIAVGRPDELAVVEQVVTELQRSPATKTTTNSERESKPKTRPDAPPAAKF